MDPRWQSQLTWIKMLDKAATVIDFQTIVLAITPGNPLTPSHWPQKCVMIPQITGNSIVYSTACPDYMEENIKAPHYCAFWGNP